MTIKRLILILIGCTCVIFTLYILSLDRPLKEETIDRAVEDYTAMQKLFKAKEIDFEAVGNLYENHLTKIAEYVDDKSRRFMEEGIWESINRGKKGSITKIAAQLVDKMILRTFFYLIEIELDSMTKKEVDREMVVKKVRKCYQVLMPLVVQSDQFLKSGNTLQKRAEVLLNELNRGLGKPKAFLTLLKSAFLIATLKEIETTEAIQKTDKMVSLEHMAAAKMYYNILFEDHALFDRKSAILVMGEFSKQPVKFNADMIRSEFKRAFNGLIPELTDRDFDRKEIPENSEIKKAEDQA